MQDLISVFLGVWFLNPNAGNPAMPESLHRVLPGVHSVRDAGDKLEMRSAGISFDSFGALEANAYAVPKGPQNLLFQFPQAPAKAQSLVSAPLGIIGAFVTGKPIYNPISTITYNGQGIWHRDAVNDNGASGNLLSILLAGEGKHSPVIGYALDGYPIYGPYAPGATRSSYRLRRITERTSLADGTWLTPGQHGPPVSAIEPLGSFIEDYEYCEGSGDLDAHNGRFAATPEFPKGTYAYSLSTDGRGGLTYPYLVGPTYYGAPLAAPVKQIRFAVKGADGKSQRFPELVHEKPLHLILVSDDLNDFMHVHPELGEKNEFGIDVEFPRPGRWHAFAQSTPAGGVNQVERRAMEIEKSTPRAAPPRTIAVKMDAPTLLTGRDLRIRFALTDAKTGGPVNDLQPYLGAWGHFILISEDKKTFIHAHPMEAAGTAHDHSVPLGPSPEMIEIVTGFDKPGRYKLWAQFQRGGVEQVVPFWVDVAAGAAVTEKGVPAGATLVTVTDRGYSPAEIVAKSGEGLRLAFRREGNTNCGGKVVFPALGISRDLPAGESVLVELPALKSGTYRFTCGMGMYKGAVVARDADAINPLDR